MQFIHTIIHRQGCYAHVQTFKHTLIAYEKWKHIEYITQYEFGINKHPMFT